MKKQTFLIVDDNRENRFLYGRLLEFSGYDVIEAKDGFHALDILSKRRVDIVLLDVMMPKLDGYEVCRRLRKMPKAKNTTVVMVTGMVDLDSEKEAFRAGANAFLRKPFSIDTLISIVKNLDTPVRPRMAVGYGHQSI